LGEESCGTLTCYKYQEGSDADDTTRIFWFDTKDLLLRKEQTGFGEFVSVSEYSYDNINVSAPSPTKPVPEGKSIYDMMASQMMESSGYGEEFEQMKKMMPSQEELKQLEQEMQSYQQSETYESAPEDYSEYSEEGF
jgi:hypothetical protein